jgi:hypothetical protein
MSHKNSSKKQSKKLQQYMVMAFIAVNCLTNSFSYCDMVSKMLPDVDVAEPAATPIADHCSNAGGNCIIPQADPGLEVVETTLIADHCSNAGGNCILPVG